jgi:endonuclease-8
MPEGDTIARAAAALHRALAGRVVTGFATGLAPLARVNDDAPLAGRTVDGCRSLGKHLLIEFSGGLLLRTHMRMSGSWHLYRPGERWQRPSRAARIRIDTDAWVAVGFDVPVAEFVWEADLPRHRPLTTLGPDLADPAFDRAEVVKRIQASGGRAIGDVILDQRVVAGLGNVLRSETLFVAGVHPDAPAGHLEAGTIARLIETGARLLQLNARPDSPRMRTTTGRRVPGQELWVYQRTGEPCRRCGTAIVSAARGLEARRVYWCPACQVR